MRSPPTGTRALFFLVLAAIATVFVVGRLWLRRTRPEATEAGLLPAGPPEVVPPR